MNIYQSAEQYLNNRISEFRLEAQRIHLITEEGRFLDPRDIEMLTKANASGSAALAVKNLIDLHVTHHVAHATAGGKTEEEALKEALPKIISAVQTRMDVFLCSREKPHIEAIIVFNRVLSALRTEEAAVAAEVV